jgi:hypothetical protein
MEQTKSGTQAFLEGRFNNVVTVLLAIVVTSSFAERLLVSGSPMIGSRNEWLLL